MIFKLLTFSLTLQPRKSLSLQVKTDTTDFNVICGGCFYLGFQKLLKALSIHCAGCQRLYELNAQLRTDLLLSLLNTAKSFPIYLCMLCMMAYSIIKKSYCFDYIEKNKVIIKKETVWTNTSSMIYILYSQCDDKCPN